jgi:hypothetical protein
LGGGLGPVEFVEKLEGTVSRPVERDRKALELHAAGGRRGGSAGD